MALSKSVIKAQDIISCNLCESETKLKWKCIDCDLLMCNKCCDKVHPKFKNAKDHTIVDIKQVGVGGTHRNPDFTNIKCKVHPTQYCCIFCSNCDNLACPSCITKGHSGHTFIEIKEAYEIKVELLIDKKGKLEKNKTKLDEGEKSLDQISVRENSNCLKTSQDIQHHREALIKEVDKYILNITEELNQNMKNVNDFISVERNIVKTNRREVEKKFKTTAEILTTMDISFFFQNADIIAKSIDDDVKEAKAIHKSVPKFKPGNILQSNVGTLIENISSIKKKEDMKVNKELTTGLKCCHFVCTCSDGSLWIGDNTSELLHKVKPEGNILALIIAINIEVEGMAVTYNNDLLIANGRSKLHLINGETGMVSGSKYSAGELLITSVNITRDHKVIVGAVSPGVEFPVRGRRVVIVMDEEGNHLTVYEHDKHKQRIFSNPIRITSTCNGSIFVVDCLSGDDKGRVLVLGNDDNIFKVYTGCKEINTMDEPLQIANITASSSGNIVVIDFGSHLQILNSSASLISYYNTRDIGIAYPYCIAFTSPTTFFLGCSPATNSTTNAKLYEIQCSGF